MIWDEISSLATTPLSCAPTQTQDIVVSIFNYYQQHWAIKAILIFLRVDGEETLRFCPRAANKPARSDVTGGSANHYTRTLLCHRITQDRQTWLSKQQVSPYNSKSYMSILASFEYLCHGSTSVINFNSFSARIVHSRQNLTSVDFRLRVPVPQILIWYCAPIVLPEKFIPILLWSVVNKMSRQVSLLQ